jgi:hypothetical protein
MTTRILLAALLLLAPVSLFGQGAGESALTEAEVEALRDSAYVANDRILTFVKFIDARSSKIQSLATKPRRPGREEDLHALYEQFTSIADELDDNLDDLGPRHRDMRKALPKLLAATERWATALKTPADNEAYNVSRKLALEAVRDLREASTQLIEEQKTWFLAHPPPKDAPVDEHERRPH